MRQFVRLLIGSTLICFAYAGSAMGAKVLIDPAEYTGQWTVDYGPAQYGAAVVSLGAPDATTGSHVVSLGGAELFFDVAANGEVTVDKNPAAATGGAGTLTFNTTPVQFNPESFQGRWRVSDGATPPRKGPGTITLVRGLSFYAMKIGATGAFTFHIADDGTVIVPRERVARGGKGQLQLNNTLKRFGSP